MSKRKIIRGIESEHEQRPQQLLRDTRTIGQKIWSVLIGPTTSAISIFVCGASAYILPQTVDLSFVIGIFIFLAAYLHKDTLPFRLPMRCKALDYNDPYPGGSTKVRKARGITFFGNNSRDNNELWFSNEDMRTHVLIFGSTGSGKTETLISLAYNSLLQGSGFIYIDGKGDNSLYSKIYSMTRSLGREDDLLLINFMTGARDIIGPQKNRLSNTLNPFSHGSSSMLSQLIVSLMESSSNSGSSDGDMWKGRAIAFIEALMRFLTYARDQGLILLDANVIRKYFLLPKLESIIADKKFPIDGRLVDISDMPDIVLDPLYNYVVNLPGYSLGNKGKQSGEVFEQHGFITMQLTRIFTSLADTYGHILRTNLAEVDFRDVVMNRRILVVLLPALEKSPPELAALGKLIVASLKAMMASGLGEKVEGSYADIVESKPTNSKTPYVCIMDEYGYYAVEGFAVVPAQARSLGFSAIFAGQDLPAFQKASKEEAASIGANTNIKICMKLEDPTETAEFFMKTAGETRVIITGGYQTKPTNLTNSYLDAQSAQVDKMNRIDLLDLREQDVGEMHIFFKSKIIRARSFFANPVAPKYLKLNQFIKVSLPRDEVLLNIMNRLNLFKHKFNEETNFSIEVNENSELDKIIFSLQNSSEDTLTNKAYEAIESFCMKEKKIENELEKMPVHQLAEGVDIFYSKNIDIDIENILDLDPLLITPLINRKQIHRALVKIEKLFDNNIESAQSIANKVINDLSNATIYPPVQKAEINKEKLLSSIDNLINFLEDNNNQSE